MGAHCREEIATLERRVQQAERQRHELQAKQAALHAQLRCAKFFWPVGRVFFFLAMAGALGCMGWSWLLSARQRIASAGRSWLSVLRNANSRIWRSSE
jgi:hypothetical protein